MATSADLRRAAQIERDRLQSVCDGADLAMVMVIVGVAPIKHEFLALALVPAILRWRASKEKAVQQRLVEDPPRYDFDEPVEVEFESWDRAPLEARSEDYVPLVVRYVGESIRIVGFENAMIDAIEKQLGAAEKGETRLADARESEAESLADESALALIDCSAALVDLLTQGWIGEEESEALLRAAEPKLHQYWRADQQRHEAPANPILPEQLRDELRQLDVPDNALPTPGSPMRDIYGMPRQAITRLRRRLFFNAATKQGLAHVLQTGTVRSGAFVTR